jgi:cysteine desulfurase
MRPARGEVFLDGNSTTPVDPRVARSICSVYRRLLGNSSSSHVFGWRSRILLEKARMNVARLIGAGKEEIFFVPSVTVGLNIVIQGAIGRLSSRNKRIAISRTEHKSVISLVRHLRDSRKCEWVELDFDRNGAVLPESVEDAAAKGVDLICISHGSGEVGYLNDLGLIIEAVKGRASLLFDVSQTAAYLDVRDVVHSADFLVFSGHKLYGPRGTAALFKRRGLDLAPLLIGAGQEDRLVPGTEDVPGALALGVASRLAERDRDQRRDHVNALRDIFWGILSSRAPSAEINGPLTKRVPGNLNITLPGVPAQLLIRRLPYIGISMASACTGSGESHVLKALGFSKSRATCTFRVGFNAFNTFDEAESSALEIAAAITQISPSL